MSAPLSQAELPKGSLLSRLLRVRVGWMLVRNTVVSSGVFLIGLGVLWLLVERAGMDEVPASGIGFVVANSLHYILGRAWIFRGTTRGVASGFALFLVNGLIGLGITMALMAVLLALTPINYLVARVLVSVFAGLTIFVLNAVWNFRRV
ncbi:GtrA family protein [Altererythrobacter lutimaris]|uniref:GtrA family protein n=1 Tax=Altererythrobacter lutimaris TaxID=2743979 RepID=A0A850H8X9_9SPHN|nr:GtrA family protein [Altererythrobacter lutimaris]